VNASSTTERDGDFPVRCRLEEGVADARPLRAKVTTNNNVISSSNNTPALSRRDRGLLTQLRSAYHNIIDS